MMKPAIELIPEIIEVLHKNEFYIRGVDGKDLAIYKYSTSVQWNVYGLDNVGKLVNSKKYYYMKDHHSSVRAVLDEERNTVCEQDYDMWGYILDDMTYDSDESIHKFTLNERDKENNYDYFGARYYDSRIGIFNSSEPVPSSSFSRRCWCS